MDRKAFYLVSGLDEDRSGPLCQRQRYATIEDAIERAEYVTRENAKRIGKPPMAFYILKAIAKVELKRELPPTIVTALI